jgi:hypothetical protein
MSRPVAHRPPDPSGTIESMMSAGAPATARHLVPFQCSTSALFRGSELEMVRSTQALRGPVADRRPKLSGGLPAAAGSLLVVHVRPFQCSAVLPASAQMSSAPTVLTSSGVAGS